MITVTTLKELPPTASTVYLTLRSADALTAAHLKHVIEHIRSVPDLRVYDRCMNVVFTHNGIMCYTCEDVPVSCLITLCSFLNII